MNGLTVNGITVNGILRQIAQAFDMPVKVILIAMLVISVIMIGMLIAEFLERMVVSVKAASVVDAIKKGKSNIPTIIKNSTLLTKQKRLLLEITLHKNLTNDMIENLAESLLDNYSNKLDFTIKQSELLIKLAPAFGLLGTLIPLGPGIIALAQGDTATLSYSLLAAFDTTIVGIIVAAIATVISLIRKRWYANDKVMLALIMSAVVEATEEK